MNNRFCNFLKQMYHFNLQLYASSRRIDAFTNQPASSDLLFAP